ncbi:MAG: FtsX-like permease family protein, partial [Phycisphaerae bacterium]|nr:FtsX-like permease family protein [Phycisphaerae bacterium]
MRMIWRLALRSLLARRGRSLLLATAVAFATALVTALACGLATVEANVAARIDRLIGAIDARIVHPHSPIFEASLVEEVRAWPGVEAVGTRLGGSLTLVREDGARGDDGRTLRITVQARGLELSADPRLNPFDLLEGRAPTAPGEIVVDPRTRNALKLKLGDRVEVQRLGDPIVLTVVGVDNRPALGALQRPFVQVDRATVADACGHGDEVSAIVMILGPETDVEAWCREFAPRVREPLVLEPAERVRSGLDREARASNLAFTLACMLGFVSCAFIVGTGLTTAFAEQVRELAMLRVIGAARGHLAAIQLAAGAALAAAGATVGVAVGIGLTALGAHAYREILPAGAALAPTGVAVAVASAILSGVVGASFSAVAATRVAPLEALRIRARRPRAGTMVRVVVIAAACLALQRLLMLLPDRDDRFWAWVFAGLPALLVAWFLLSVPILRGAAALLSPAIERLLRLPRGMLGGAVALTPYRLGLTAGALMIGLAILVVIWSNGVGVLSQIVERVRFADSFVFKSNGLTADEQARLRAIPGVRASVAVGYLPLRVLDDLALGVRGIGPPNVTCVGFEPEAFFELNRIEWIEGDPRSALPKLRSGEAVLVAQEFLTARGLHVGDRIRLGGPRRSHEFEIAGVVSSAGLDVVTQFFGIRTVYMEQAVSCVFMDFDAVAKWFDSREAFILQFDLGDGADEALERSIGDEVSARVPGAVFSSGRAIRQAVISIGRTVLALTSAVAVSALLLASFGVANVVAAGIAARRREFGVLRAVGGSRGTVAGVVLGETALVAIAAAISGTMLGLQLAAMERGIFVDIAGLEVPFRMPWIA